MNQEFNDICTRVTAWTKSKCRSKEILRNVTYCVNGLRTYLEAGGMDGYSEEAARKWLETLKGTVYEGKFNCCVTTVSRMNDLFHGTDIQPMHCDPGKTKYGRLSAEYKGVIDGIHRYLQEKEEATVCKHIGHCTSILLGFQEKGVDSVRCITYEILMEEVASAGKESPSVRADHKTALKYLLIYLHSQNLVPYGFSILMDSLTGLSQVDWNCVPGDVVSALKNTGTCDTPGLGLADLLRIQEGLVAEHTSASYSKTSVSTLVRTCRCFYLFLDVNGLEYSSRASDVWLDSIRSQTSESEYKHIRRILDLIRSRAHNENTALCRMFYHRPKLEDAAPSWCIAECECFLEEKKAAGLSDSSLKTYKTCILVFCIYIDSQGIRSYREIDAGMVKKFNLADTHSTPQGKAAANSRIRMFLRFLGEKGCLGNPYLFLSLPSTSAPSEDLVVTLTEKEQEDLRTAIHSSGGQLTLRDTAVIQLGLYMGLRASDIVGITIDQIDWDTPSLTFVQKKTRIGLTLPMPTPVANAVFRYITMERPASDSPYVFLNSRAPYNPAGTSTCRNALLSALPGRSVPGSGFHVTRKTFATNLLRNGVKAQQISDSLGHSGPEPSSRYLSLDVERMHLCPISLAEKGILMKGGFGNEA